IGVNIGGGIGSMKGNILKTQNFFTATGFNQNGPILTPGQTQTLNLAKDEFVPYFPLLKVEVEGAVRVAPGLKVTVAGGLNFPAARIRFGAVYLIGAR